MGRTPPLLPKIFFKYFFPRKIFSRSENHSESNGVLTFSKFSVWNFFIFLKLWIMNFYDKIFFKFFGVFRYILDQRKILSRMASFVFENYDFEIFSYFWNFWYIRSWFSILIYINLFNFLFSLGLTFQHLFQVCEVWWFFFKIFFKYFIYFF